MAMSSVYIDTLGCFKNQEDSERAAGLLESSGFAVAGSPDEADVVMVNTCGFIEDAKRESIDRVLELARQKGRGAKLIVSGCLSQRYPGEIFEEIPEADAVIGVNEYERLPEIVAELLGEGAREPRREAMPDPNRAGSNDGEGENGRRADGRILMTGGKPGILTGPRIRETAGATAYLKIAEGCNNRCAYCAIPAIRGPYRSVPHDILVGEAVSLVAAGARELVLIAQDVSAYGSDFGHDDSLSDARGNNSNNGNSPHALPRLIEGIIGAACGAAEGSGIDWIRLMYCYEERVTDELIEAIAKHREVCNYIDIPLQHISDSVLARMGRRSTRVSIEGTISRLRAAVPDIAIRTTLMTGFPGESESDFTELLDFVSEQRFERLGVFAYSPEDGTPAADMPDQIPRELAEERRDVIMRRQLEISLEKNRSRVGRTMKVLVEESEEDGEAAGIAAGGYCYVGRTEYDAPEIDGSVIFSSEAPIRIGSFADVLITDAMDYDLVGKAL
ncbi:MAG: 30S ribosomal protein S12 methylthiotransferase RimO [Clostridiales Family XIII bacterium]|jgi:ribosomal protein S12 methylthiotransferase|nr:30S ribosomal protein S12 methylthiotransferase RimO [Clostridiales Family XIII bacterium]